VTERCDLRCGYCRPGADASGPGGARRPLSDAALVALVEQIHGAWPVGKLRLTGGEPLLRPGLADFVLRLRAALPDAELCLTTNGTRLHAMAPALRDAGVTAVNLSIDSLDPARFRALTGGDLERVLRGARALPGQGFRRLKINAVLQRSVNGDALGELVQFASSLAAEMRFIELMPLGCAAPLFAREHMPAAEALERLSRRFEHLSDLGRSGTAHRHLLRVQGREVTVGFISPVTEPFCSGCSRLRLDSTGLLWPCLRRGDALDLCPADGEHSKAGHVARVIMSLGRGRRSHATSWPARRMVAIGG